MMSISPARSKWAYMWAWAGVTPSRAGCGEQVERKRVAATRVPIDTRGRDGDMVADLLSESGEDSTQCYCWETALEFTFERPISMVLGGVVVDWYRRHHAGWFEDELSLWRRDEEHVVEWAER